MFDDEIIRLATDTLQDARDKGAHLVTAESCTGGLIMGALTEIAGSSDVVDRAFVTYTNRAKMEVLKVPKEIIQNHGAVSEQCARAMAEGAIHASASTLSVAVTGIAGPGGGSDQKPVGLVHMAAHIRDGLTWHEEHQYGDIGRENVRLETVKSALRLAQKLLTNL